MHSTYFVGICVHVSPPNLTHKHIMLSKIHTTRRYKNALYLVEKNAHKHEPPNNQLSSAHHPKEVVSPHKGILSSYIFSHFSVKWPDSLPGLEAKKRPCQRLLLLAPFEIPRVSGVRGGGEQQENR